MCIAVPWAELIIAQSQSSLHDHTIGAGHETVHDMHGFTCYNLLYCNASYVVMHMSSLNCCPAESVQSL